MRTTEKDVIFICKNHYNSEKYNSSLDALKAYQSYICGVDINKINYTDVYDFAVQPTAKEYFNANNWDEMIRDRMFGDIRSAAWQGETIQLLPEYMCKLFIRQIGSLRIKQNGNWIIDMSDYEDIDSNTDWWIDLT